MFDLPPETRLLAISTYDGSGQATHPDVLRGKTGDSAFWMALTPYPFSDEKLENPSIYRSRDGLEWREPAPRVNPVAARPPFDHNCDPDLVRHDGELVLFWLETQRREYRPDERHFQDLRVARSPDGVSWSEPEVAIHWDLHVDPLFLSPAVVRAPVGWRLYLVNPPAEEIVWLPSHDLKSFGPAGGALETGLDGVRPWHLDVFAVPGGWVALLCARGPDATGNLDVDVWIGASRDLDRWTFRPRPLLAAGPALLDTDVVYRSTGLVEQGRLVVWFSARTVPGRWIVGVTSFDARLVDELLEG